MYYQLLAADNCYIGIVWQYAKGKPLIEKIILPCGRSKLLEKIKEEYPEINKNEKKIPGDIAGRILALYYGEKIKFNYASLNLAKLTNFSRRVLKQTCLIPRGQVATYSGLAMQIGSPRAARAVGTALANNPFPLVIPCHRVVRADGFAGGFGGGIKMKKALLEKEDVATNSKGQISAK